MTMGNYLTKITIVKWPCIKSEWLDKHAKITMTKLPC